MFKKGLLKRDVPLNGDSKPSFVKHLNCGAGWSDPGGGPRSFFVFMHFAMFSFRRWSQVKVFLSLKTSCVLFSMTLPEGLSSGSLKPSRKAAVPVATKTEEKGSVRETLR